MPSAKRKRTLRPKRRSVNRGKQLLWFLLVANVVAGVFFSPATAVRKVRVVGVGAEHTALLDEVTAEWDSTPWVRLPLTRSRYKILQTPEFRDVRIESNPFGRALITLTPREAVAWLDREPVMYLDSEGVLFSKSVPFDQEAGFGPEIELVLSSFPTEPSATIVQHWEGGIIANLCEKLNSALPKVAFQVQLDELGAIILRHGDGREILFGSSDRLDEKLAKLIEIAGPTGELPDDIQVLNLVEPDRPAVRLNE